MGRVPQPGPLAMVDRLLWQAEVASRTPADLDDDQHSGWPRVDRDEVELVAADADVPGEDRPAPGSQLLGDGRLGGIAESLRASSGSRRRSVGVHARSVAGGAYPGITRGPAQARAG